MFANRSSHMVRPKDELKRELLMGLSKNSRPPQPVQKIEPQQIQSSHSRSFSQKGSDSNYSILDQFSKCPYLEIEQQFLTTNFLNKFMHSQHQNKKDSNYGQSLHYHKSIPHKIEASTQTITKIQVSHSPYAAQKAQTLSTIQPFSKTPIKKAEPKSGQKSLIDVSKNLSNCKYLPSALKQNFQQDKVLTESIIKNEQKDYWHQKQYQQSHRKNGKDKLLQEFDAEEHKNIENQQNIDKPPLIKKIQLNLPKKQQITAIPETSERNFNEDHEDEQLNKILSKKSSIKELIKKKSSSSSGSSKQTQAKWQKQPQRNQRAQKKISQQKSQTYDRNSDDIMNLFPPYQSSSSALQAVIEEQNQSLEQSVQFQNKSKKDNLPDQFQPTPPKMQKKKTSKDKSSQLKQISISDLSLEDVSQIEVQNRSQDKNFMNKSSLKKIPSERKQGSKNSLQKQEDNIDLERYICNDIGKDIQGLKSKIENDLGSDSDIFSRLKSYQESKPSSGSRPSGKNSNPSSDSQIPKQAQQRGDGSEGVSRKELSMLEFFDKFNEKIDFQDISKDINDLRNKIESDSSNF